MYSREDVHKLMDKMGWLRQGRSVKVGCCVFVYVKGRKERMYGAELSCAPNATIPFFFCARLFLLSGRVVARSLSAELWTVSDMLWLL